MRTQGSDLPLAKLLAQGPRLLLKAQRDVCDVNEAYMMVHGVMAHALEQGAPWRSDVDDLLATATRDWRQSTVE